MTRKDPLTDPLRLGTIFTIGPYLLPQLVPALHKSAPQMPLFIEETFTARLLELLKNGEVDAAILALLHVDSARLYVPPPTRRELPRRPPEARTRTLYFIAQITC